MAVPLWGGRRVFAEKHETIISVGFGIASASIATGAVSTARTTSSANIDCSLTNEHSLHRRRCTRDRQTYRAERVVRLTVDWD
jgi:hypothetical protein